LNYFILVTVKAFRKKERIRIEKLRSSCKSAPLDEHVPFSHVTDAVEPPAEKLLNHEQGNDAIEPPAEKLLNHEQGNDAIEPPVQKEHNKNIAKKRWTDQEIKMLIKKVEKLRPDWKKIAKNFPGRTIIACKLKYYSLC
jgi:hypothetical protein